jgi:hypothetical protein
MINSSKDNDSYNFAIVNDIPVDSMVQRYEPPPVGEYNIIYFTKENAEKDKIEKLSTLHLAESEEGYQFRFYMNSNVGTEKTISFNPHLVPDGLKWVVASPSSGLVYKEQDIKTTARQREYLLIVGTEEYIAQATASYRQIPDKFHLSQNFPNPFNPTTSTEIQLPVESKLNIHVYDVLGRKIKTMVSGQLFEPGYHLLEWHGKNNAGQPVAAGMYFLNVKSAQFNMTIKMILQK